MRFSLSSIFRSWGRLSGEKPWESIACSFVVILAMSAGYTQQRTESRLEKMWVPTCAKIIDHKEYMDANWPSDAGNEAYMTTCGAGTANCNILEPDRLKELFKLHINFYKTVIDGSELATQNKDDYQNLEDDPETNPSAKYGNKTWVVDKELYPGSHSGPLHSKCALLNENTCNTANIFWSLFDGDVETGAHPKNPNFFDSNYATLQQVLDRVNAYTPDLQRGQSNLDSILGQITYDSSGKITGATHLSHSWFVTNAWVRNKVNRRFDLLNLEFEYQGLLGLGFDPNVGGKSRDNLASIDKSKLDISPFFQRSFPDSFEATVNSDLGNLSMACALIIVYLSLNLGKRDSVHSMFGLAIVTLLIVASSMVAGSGFCYFIGLADTNLLQLLWFLILGLGVDDAFVLVNEFNRVAVAHPYKSIPERISLTAERAGHSILVTSITDGLAFLVGSLTVLPALRSFCIFAGVVVLVCFILQMSVFLPCVAINAARTQANRRDIFCCTKPARKHKITSPLGWLCIPGEPYVLEQLFTYYANFLLKTPVRLFVIVAFLGILLAGLSGIVQLETDFRIEWFIPDDDKIQDFLQANDEIFKQALHVTVYITNQTDHFAERQAILDLGNYINQDAIFNKNQSTSWALSFEEYLKAVPGIDVSTPEDYFTQLHSWVQPGQFGAIFEKAIQWKDKNNPAQGVRDSKMSTILNSEHTKTSTMRFNTMEKFRKECDDRVKGSFPFSFSFFFWEEAGILMKELIQNLVISSICIAIIVVVLIGDIKIAALVCFGLIVAITEMVGFAHYWGVTANGSSVIFILLCVGLNVDYSAHIAHMFKIAKGTGVKRSKGALIRIGPSVFNALLSTFLAVAVLGFASSYVFRLFFKILFLTSVIGGLHGLMWLPVVLSFTGGSKTRPKRRIAKLKSATTISRSTRSKAKYRRT